MAGLGACRGWVGSGARCDTKCARHAAKPCSCISLCACVAAYSRAGQRPAGVCSSGTQTCGRGACGRSGVGRPPAGPVSHASLQVNLRPAAAHYQTHAVMMTGTTATRCFKRCQKPSPKKEGSGSRRTAGSRPAWGLRVGAGGRQQRQRLRRRPVSMPVHGKPCQSCNCPVPSRQPERTRLAPQG